MSLVEVAHEAAGCVRCPQLVATRTQVVFGAGDADADLMLVGEAPGRLDDERGLPFSGAAGELLDELLAGIARSRADVYVTTCLKCRPPGNREALPQELSNCRGWLDAQLDLVRPKVVATLGNFTTKALRADPAAVTAIHGRAEVRVLGPRAVRLLPLFHPSAALYTRSVLDALREDFARIPALLELPRPEQPEPAAAPPPPPAPEEPDAPDGQLGLF